MAPRVSLLLILLLPVLLQFPCLQPSSASSVVTVREDCPESCGGVPIPYPFGVGEGCSRDSNFDVYCDRTSTPPKPLLFSNQSNVEILSVSLLEGKLRFPIGYQIGNDKSNEWIDLKGSNYVFSEMDNVFTGIGCHTFAVINATGEYTCISGCATLCSSPSNTVDGNCTGMGCCEASIPGDLDFYRLRFPTFIQPSPVVHFSECSYAFLQLPTVLDWVAGKDKCEKAKLKTSSYACISGYSECYDSADGRGYRCNCSNGYQGNPYLRNGCQDINECDIPSKCPANSNCFNTLGNYICECPKGTIHDRLENACQKKEFTILPLGLGLSTGLFLLIILGSWIYWGLYKIKIMLSRKNFFEENGGLMLKSQISSLPGSTFTIFSVGQIEKATKKFNNEMIIGRGRQGIVYRGVLDNRLVAIKKSRSIDESQRSEFAKEMLILSQINHRNILKILGCCLEVDIPILVYEFISHGTLFHYLHGENKFRLSFLERLRITIESTDALNCLHAQASPSIVHGDLKSADILLDGNLAAKISDFGASKMAPMDKDQFAALVQGTYGYLDPESLQTYQLTSKSYVYSFGVILADLITRRTALYCDSLQKQKNLALDIVSSVRNNRLLTILDAQIVNEHHIPYLHDVAMLTCRCLSMTGDDSPTMKEVVMELEGIRSLVLSQGFWIKLTRQCLCSEEN
ncbi:unnamed protein product [Spirodela intermedia]|uniref:Uncharacterized protein n=1 Tax=Spirodela intermedia TaxID=51605 RepID=A0A7I8JNR4_SPIIN|nr:unnamed protein product [Spirodela intermedia]CAA6671411.1 unnamed protein product [Spirodela intermedia]